MGRGRVFFDLTRSLFSKKSKGNFLAYKKELAKIKKNASN